MEYNFFVSQNEQVHYPDLACGVASLMMLLRYHNLENDISFIQLANSLKLTVPPVMKGYGEDDPVIGVYPEDVYKFLYEKNILFRVSFFKDEWEKCLADGPIMVLVAWENEWSEREEHWIVLLSKNDDTFTYLDPWYTKESNNYLKRISEDEFHQCYTGIACQIITNLSYQTL